MSRSDRGGTLPANGLYDPAFEHDACGVGLVADLAGRKSHALVRQALSVLERLAHRGATGAESETGDGSGILVQLPHAFLCEIAAATGFELPLEGLYGAGLVFLPRDPDDARKVRAQLAVLAGQEGLKVLGWRVVPTVDDSLGETARHAQPRIEQVFVGASPELESSGALADPLALERRCFVLRKRAEHELLGTYFPSLSSRTMVYKGMLTAQQVDKYFPDLSDDRFMSGLALVHSRFSTNTFPSWSLAHPYRYVAHNGEINTLMGNRNWMQAREALLRSDLIPGDLARIFPVCTPGASDSASFDEVLELLYLGGRSLPHAVLMMIPEAWENNDRMDPKRRDFYRYHRAIMEPWDGPAAIAFTDGTLAGAVLDRNGLRPARYWVTDEGLVVMASEVGVVDVDPASVVRKGRLQPGRMFLVDTAGGRIVEDAEIKRELVGAHPYGEWADRKQVELRQLPPRTMLTPQHASVVAHQRLFGYTSEELRLLVAPMAVTGGEPLGSMGNDSALAVLSNRSRLLYDYFFQLFAQVTNPPLDAIREELVTSMDGVVGPEDNLLDQLAGDAHQIILPRPVIDRDDLAKLLYVNEYGETPGFKAFAVDGLFPVGAAAGRDHRHRRAAERWPRRSTRSAAGCRTRSRTAPTSSCSPTATPRPSWHPSPRCSSSPPSTITWCERRSDTRVGLVVESGDAREVHHVALLLGYGAAAVNPYLAFESIDDMIASGQLEGITPRQGHRNYVKAASKGVLKIMSKMGISTISSYNGAQVFEAVGLDRDVVDEYFTGTTSRIGGVGLDVIAAEVAERHHLAHLDRPTERAHRELEVGGEYQWRREGELHLFTPRTVFKLQHGTRTRSYKIFKEYTQAVDEQSEHRATLRGLLQLKAAPERRIPIDEVEPASSIMRRFSTGAMSYGSISAEAHENLAIAMNRIGGRSNTGEGGEDAERFVPDANGDLRRSAIKQVASGRFGVTSEYLVNSDDLQIKISQGAKPGEGGQLPGTKVYPWIARTRSSTPGVGLISPPPHHDIYSIEDIAQLIHDLKSANPAGQGARQARGRGRGRHGGRGRRQGPLGRRAHLGSRRRDRRRADDVDQARRHPLGARPRGDPADPHGQRAARPDRGPGGRSDEDGARRDHRRPARGGGVRVRDRPPGGVGLHHDAGLPSRHVPGRDRDPESRAATALQREAGIRHHVLRVHRRGGARAAGLPRPAFPGRGDRPGRPAGHRAGGRPLEGRGSRPEPDPRRPRRPLRRHPALRARAGPRSRPGARSALPRGVPPGDRGRDAGPPLRRHQQRRPHRRHPARLRDHPPPRRPGTRARDHRPHLPWLCGTELRRLRAPGGDHAARG